MGQERPTVLRNPSSITDYSGCGFEYRCVPEIVSRQDFYDVKGFSEGLAPVKDIKNEKWGFIDTEGRLAIPHKYDSVGHFSEGLAAIEKDGKQGFINSKDEWLIELESPYYWRGETYFSDGLARIRGPSHSLGFINKKGEVVIEPQEYFIRNFHEGLAAIKKDDKLGFVNTKGEMVIEPKFDWKETAEFSEGLASIRRDDENGDWEYGFINKKGDWKIEPEYSYAGDFSDGWARVKKDGKYGFINQENEWVIEPQYYWVSDFSEGLARFKKYRYDDTGFINKQNEVVIEAKFDGDVDNFSGGLAGAEKLKYTKMLSGLFGRKVKSRKWGFINTRGEWVVRPRYEMVSDFSGGAAFVLPKSGALAVPRHYMGVEAPGWRLLRLKKRR